MQTLTDEQVAEIIKNGEPLDFATLNFKDCKTRKLYRSAQNIAFEHIANRECVFCFNKSNENGMGELGELERIGYAHTYCLEAFYHVGFEFKLIGFNDEIDDYSWDIVTSKQQSESKVDSQ